MRATTTPNSRDGPAIIEADSPEEAERRFAELEPLTSVAWYNVMTPGEWNERGGYALSDNHVLG